MGLKTLDILIMFIGCPRRYIGSSKPLERGMNDQIALSLILYGLELGLHCAALPPWKHHPHSWGFP
jgi:hypothetical protein